MMQLTFKQLISHAGHKVEVRYIWNSVTEGIDEVRIVCHTCNKVLAKDDRVEISPDRCSACGHKDCVELRPAPIKDDSWYNPEKWDLADCLHCGIQYMKVRKEAVA